MDLTEAVFDFFCGKKMSETITSSEDVALDDLCSKLRAESLKWNRAEDWPETSLQLCGQSGVYRWFLSEEKGGFGWSERDQIVGYLRLAEADLVTTFIITQYMGAIRRIAASANEGVANKWLPRLIGGEAFATVGISHLTTSRRHLDKPVLRARETSNGFLLSGMSPWVTGGAHSDLLVVGATLDDGRQILVAVPSGAKGVEAKPGADLVALSASCTDQVFFNDVEIETSDLLGGPVENVLQTGVGAKPGGLQTSTLAVGLSMAASSFLSKEAENRSDLREPSEKLRNEVLTLRKILLDGCDNPASADPASIRADANRLVLRSTQAALMAAKGAGFVEGHPAGRWCRQALFFLVWSCPQPISHAHLCELAGAAESVDFGSAG